MEFRVDSAVGRVDLTDFGRQFEIQEPQDIDVVREPALTGGT
ncbi:hypothetical protein [Aeromicrobium sp.]